MLLTDARRAARVRGGQLVPLDEQDRAGWDRAAIADTVDYAQVVALYDRLRTIDPSPIVALNRAIAVAELDGPEVALALVDPLPLEGYHAWHATRAHLLRKLGRTVEAKEQYDAALAATDNTAERAYLTRKRGELV